MTTRVAIVGGTGKLGGVITKVVEDSPHFEVHAVLTSKSSFDELDGADIVVDATQPAVSESVIDAALERGIPTVVGTSGWSASRLGGLRGRVEAAGVGVLVVPNFSLGSIVASALAALAAPHFASVEIIEAHRDTKVDSPSGTAVRTAELIAEARSGVGPVDAPHADQRARGQQVGSVPVHSLRRPGVIAKQDVVLSGPGESVTITHDTIDPAAAYTPGIVIALGAVRDIEGLMVGLDGVMGLGTSPRNEQTDA